MSDHIVEVAAAVMLRADGMFASPAFPLEDVRDPTGAGDAFAGGVLGRLAMLDAPEDMALREAIVYGTVMASFTVHDFGTRGLYDIAAAAIESRVRGLRLLTQFGSSDSLQRSGHA